eukprot:GHVU01069261.1.p5 GENE.GHVU01069261.1~~GHVU01069261.1.p5  ORF type:complete len:102 (+),score=13.54 GHVU01069261.1:668-973(+)
MAPREGGVSEGSVEAAKVAADGDRKETLTAPLHSCIPSSEMNQIDARGGGDKALLICQRTERSHAHTPAHERVHPRTQQQSTLTHTLIRERMETDSWMRSS